MKTKISIATILFGFLSAASSLAMSAEPPADLSCEAKVRLANGKEQTFMVHKADHLMFGPIVVGGLNEGGEDPTRPLLSSGFVGMVVEAEDIVAIHFELKVNKTEFQPYTETDTMAKSTMVLMRNSPLLSKGSVFVRNLDGGAVLVNCELNPQFP